MKEKMDGQNQYNRISKAVLHAAIVLYGFSMVFLFYKQAGWTGGAVYESDLPVHIRMIVEDGWYYSLTALVYQVLYLIPFALPGGVPFGNLAIAIFLALCGTFSVYLTGLLLRDMQEAVQGDIHRALENDTEESGEYFSGWKQGDKTKKAVKRYRGRTLTAWHLLGGLVLNLVMPCYIRGIADGRYIGMESASIWHNSTYIVMKLMGLLCVLCYGRLAKKYRQGLSGKEWLCFTLLLSVCTAVKPSFLIVAAPVMAVFLLVDLFQQTPFRRVFAFGSTVFLPLLVVLFQNMVLFGAETGNGWEIRPGYALSLHSGYPLIAAILSIFFPLMSLPFFWKECHRDRWFLGSWLMAAFGFLEVFLFAETGGRASDGNFMWGYSFAIVMIFAISFVKWVESSRKVKETLQGGMGRESYFRISVFLVSGLVLCWHLYCGIYFYVHLLQGVSYWMWD